LVLDFSEIPTAKGGSAGSDAFEQFASELLKHIGHTEVRGPSRGPDGGRDLIVEEVRKGISRDSKIRWLVSCKHFVHGGRAVGVKDESDISDRVNQHGCSGFLGIYSTLPSTALEERLKQQSFEYQLLTPEQIEKYLLDSPEALKLAERFFPESMKNWSRENPKPAVLFRDTIEVRCENCGRDLLDGPKKGIYVVLYRYEEKQKIISGVHFVSKGNCDRQLIPSVRLGRH
jgi:Restriction endonuclease